MSTDDSARRISIGLDAHGRPVARKQGDPDRLAHEADVLARVQMPGVVRLITHDQLTGELGLAWTGGRSLADPPAHRPAAEVTNLVRALAATVSAIHSAGVVHQRIEPSHVLITDDGPLLTGFAEASVAGDGEAVDPHIDVAAIGRLIDVLLGPASVPARPGARTTALRWVPARARRSGHDRGTTDHSAGRAASNETTTILRRIARRAQDRSTAPCTMEELRSALDTIAAPPSSPMASFSLDSSDSGRGRSMVDSLRHRRRVVGVAAVAVSIVAALIVLPRFTGAAGRVAAAGAPDDTIVDETDSPVDTGATTATAAAPASTAAAAPATSAPTTSEAFTGELIWPSPTSVAGDPEQFTVRARDLETGIVESGGVRYRLAADPQDRWLTGDWNCDAAASLAILRLPSGAVDVFDAWPEPGRSVTSRRVALIAGAVELAATAEECPRLAVTDADGNVITLVAP